MNRLIILCTLISSVTSECNSNTGPSGIIGCFQSPHYYGQYQWGTCLTDNYIRTKSKGKYLCENSSSTYCYYQCMLELYDLLSGLVSAECACKAGDKYTESNLTLPSNCYSPSGTDCNWYKDCLERRYRCSESNDDYGMAFATKFCNLYDDNYDDFSSQGQLWIDSVRKCLQVSLVPIIRPWKSFNCKEVKEKAFASHVPCYVNPNPDAPEISLCHLGSKDFLHVFLTIKGSLGMAPSETVKGFWKTMTNCASNFFENFSFSDALRYMEIILEVKVQESHRRRRSVTDYNENPQNLSDSIVNKIAEQLNWEKKGIIWFSDVKNYTTEPQKQIMSINIFLANQNTYDLNAKNKSSADMNDTVLDFQTKAREGNLFATTDAFAYKAISMKGCLDFKCEEIQFEVTAQNKDQHSSHTGYIILGAVCGVIFLVLSSVAIACFLRKR